MEDEQQISPTNVTTTAQKVQNLAGNISKYIIYCVQALRINSKNSNLRSASR